MSEAPLLRPVKPDLTPECAAFVNTLRELFVGLGISVRRYAARRHRDAGSISRFLNGSRVPPWEFVEDLLRDLAEVQQIPVKPEVFTHIRNQHREALRVSNAGLYELQVLNDQLEQADREQRQAAVREQALLEALQARQRRIAELEIERRQLESDWTEERIAKQKLSELHLDRVRDHVSEIDRLRQEVEELRIKLHEAETLNQTAESRCKALEEQIEELESKYASKSSEAPPAENSPNVKQQTVKIAYESGKRYVDFITGSSIEKIIEEIVRRETYDARPPRQLYDAIAAHVDLATLTEIFSRLEEAAQETAAYTLLRAVLRNSAVDIVFAVLNSAEAEILRVRTYRADDMLLWFTYDSSPSRIIDLLKLLRQKEKEDWSVSLLQKAGQGDYGETVKLLQVIALVESSDTRTILSSTARNVDADSLPRFLHALRNDTMNEQADWLIKEFVKARKASVEALRTSLQVLGATADLRALERVTAERNG
ncbi:hypothetical protein [Streptomyces brasiliscabiei]|uniref:hypothetical protein n=1 Tax=Streptomyces brasiliscabiei TaxID=2736302 RepID=UPI001C0F8E53|nr:hypothetical protein [Streptomyces brasiliscabiei]